MNPRLLLTLLLVASPVMAEQRRPVSSAGEAEQTEDRAPRHSNLMQEDKDAVTLRIGQLFHDNYVFPEKGKAIQRALQEKESSEAFAAIADAEAFRKAIRDTIRGVVDDKHIIILHASSRNEDNSTEVVSDLEQQFEERKAMNFGIPELKVLESNIGYIKITKFTSPELFAPVMRAGSEYLKHVDGLILDLRSRGGGRSETVLLLLSYFLPSNTHVFNWRFRDTDTIEKNWTLPYVDGHRFTDIPIAVLTSERTFSGSEAFCYAMKHHGMATVIGERTRGGAHTYKEMLVNERFLVLVPHGRAISVKTGHNWEGRGVLPTISTPSESALEKAKLELAKAIEKQSKKAQN